MPELVEVLRLLGESVLVSAVAALALRLRAAGRRREALSAARRELRAREEELARLRAEVLPQAVADAHRQAEETTQGLLRSVARTVQGLANSQQKKITEMLSRHDDPDFVEDLLVVDHTNAQILRRSAGITVVCGSWPGRQHNATPLIDVVRGAVSRILDYRRVQIVRLEDGRAVVGRVVEGLVLAVAELLENATRYSNPSTVAQVHVQLTHNGLALVIEDAGIGLNPAERERIARTLAADGPEPDLTRLGDPPHFGLVVCGLLARRYGFSVHVDGGSAFGGVRAVVNLPSALLTDPVAESRTTAGPAPPPQRPGPGAPAAATTARGLPRRTRRHAAPGQPGEPEAVSRPPVEPRGASAALGGFLRGSRAAHRPVPNAEEDAEP
jgi:hypothetical protein